MSFDYRMSHIKLYSYSAYVFILDAESVNTEIHRPFKPLTQVERLRMRQARIVKHHRIKLVSVIKGSNLAEELTAAASGEIEGFFKSEGLIVCINKAPIYL